MQFRFVIPLIGLWLGLGIWTASAQTSPEKPEFIILQLNDVYEIGTLEGGKSGGLARVASLRDSLRRECPHVITVLAGDFISPSLIGTLKDETGQAIRGRQMVEVMNALGVDYVAFGNHEFDYAEEALQAALDASTFTWLGGNVRRKTSTGIQVFHKNTPKGPEPLADYVIHALPRPNGDTLHLAFLAYTLPFNRAKYVEYDPAAWEKLKQDYQQAKEKAAYVLLISHQDIADDEKLAQQMPQLPLIMGGHDHVNMRKTVGNVLITKADANAKTVFVHRFYREANRQSFTLQSTLAPIDAHWQAHPLVQEVVDKWEQIAEKSMLALGYQPKAAVIQIENNLDGRESTIRYQPTLLGQIIAKASQAAGSSADLGLLNSGSIRIDDQLTGTITQTDILRILPYGGALHQMDCSGDILTQLLNTGLETNHGQGGYLQIWPFPEKKRGKWYLMNQKIAPRKIYKVVLPAFVAEGKEKNLEFLQAVPSQELDTQRTLGVPNDVRQVLIHYLQKYGLNY
ncbi:MAG: bifunctional metallophosphatase/5'-nucleotidase [Microscillaceae bacterium]|nr:bifunctional metallophosphatase/5'-nucleotidase [Microscillaceae bacterium]